VSAFELLERTIARIETLNQRLHAITFRDFDRAEPAARGADAALARGERRPLLGIPVTLGEPFKVVRLPWGDPVFEDFRPTGDAVVASRRNSAGAVIIGDTNIPLGLRDFQSYNEVYETTSNPWDLGRSPCCCSGSSAATRRAALLDTARPSSP